MYCVIYDGNCNLCVNLVRVLEGVDQGQRFQYVPMQDAAALAQFGITPADGEAGMMLIDLAQPHRRWQGSDAAEEIGRQMPLLQGLVATYRALPGAKPTGDRVYAYIRDHRYQLFGQRADLYHPTYPHCPGQACAPFPTVANHSVANHSVANHSVPDPS
jgi:predicted DCC family thiol-disulfide oxidoreductase YuxK